MLVQAGLHGGWLGAVNVKRRRNLSYRCYCCDTAAQCGEIFAIRLRERLTSTQINQPESGRDEAADQDEEEAWQCRRIALRKMCPKPAFKGWGCILNQPKWSMSSEVMRAAVTVKPTNGPAPTLSTSVRPA